MGRLASLTSEIEATQSIESKLDRFWVLARVLALRASQRESVLTLRNLRDQSPLVPWEGRSLLPVMGLQGACMAGPRGSWTAFPTIDLG